MDIIKRFKESFLVLVVIFVLIASQWKLWLAHQVTVTHDSIIWYGIFSYFTDCLHNGFLPLWNPYMNCGEPFFLNINILHLWDPSTLFLILAGKLIKTDFLILYQYDLLLRYIIFICGAYLFFRYISKYKISAFIAFLSLAFSSFSTTYLRQHAFILPFYLLPWILWLILRFLKEGNAGLLLWIAFFAGIVIPSYHSMFIIVSVGLVLLLLLFTRAVALPNIKYFKENYRVSLLALLIFFLLALNTVPQFLSYTKDIIPTARLFEAPAAAHSFPADFLNLFTPYSFILHFFNWGYMSESFLYIGLLPLFFAVIGLLFSRHKYKVAFIITSVVIVLLMLGERYFIYSIFRRVVPFFSIIRNTHTFGPFFILCLTFFTCIGLDVLFDSLYLPKKRSFPWASACGIAVLIIFSSFFINYQFFRSFRSIILQYNILNNFPVLVTPEALPMLKGYFYKSYFNGILFGAGCAVIFALFRKPGINTRIKYIAIILFISTDLLLFNQKVFNIVTMPAGTAYPPHATLPVYSDSRIPVIQPEYPFYAFTPSMYKIFSAFSTKIPWVTTHFYEMKDFYNFANNQLLSDEVKNVMSGITAPKLRFSDQVVVLPDGEASEELRKIDVQQAKYSVFIEKKLPPEYAQLERDLEDIDSSGAPSGNIKVMNFNPNGLSLEVYCEKEGMLYYSDSFDRSWRALINGKVSPIYKTNLAFKGILLERGRSAVRFVYDPKFYKFGLLSYFAALMIMSAVFILWLKNKIFQR